MALYIYNFIILLFALVFFPIYIFKSILNKKYRQTIKERFGLVSKEEIINNKEKKIIFFHAASIGEIMIAKKLIKNLNNRKEDYNIILSTSTHSAKKLAKKEFKNEIYITMLPFDFLLIIKHFLKKVSPDLVVIIEPDLWPNFVNYAKKYSNSIIMINAWIGKKSVGEYLFIPGLLSNMLNKFDFISVKSQMEYQNIKPYIYDLNNKVKIINDLKFDISDKGKNNKLNKEHQSIIKQLKNDKYIYLVAGSTHEGEEKILLNIYKKIKNIYPNLKIILAPRNTNRINDIVSIVKKNKFNFLKRSNYQDDIDLNYEVFILDTMGELRDFYSVSYISFIGGTLIKKGGHNPLEPALRENIVLFGPNYFNIKDSANFLINNEIAYVVNSEKDLFNKITQLISNWDDTKRIAKKAAKIIEKQDGTVKKTEKIILDFIK